MPKGSGGKSGAVAKMPSQSCAIRASSGPQTKSVTVQSYSSHQVAPGKFAYQRTTQTYGVRTTNPK